MYADSHPRPADLTGFRRAHRTTDQPVLGGVCGGLAVHLALPVLWLRVGFIALVPLGGLGLMLYGALWIFLPADPGLVAEAPGLESASRTGKRPRRGSRLADAGPAIALGAMAFGLVLVADSLFGRAALFWPVVIGLAGVVLLWRQADEAQRARWSDSTSRVGPVRAVIGDGSAAAWGRVLAGVGLVVGALVLVSISFGASSGSARNVLVAVMLGVGGVGLVVGPWVVRLVADLGTERAERVRTQERADMAAHLHDSVLQTLALIQKNAHDPTTVARLARAQERDLRSWLFDDAPGDRPTVAGALKEAAARVEDEYGIVVDVVVVGDAEVTGTLGSLVQAAGEALVNAAKHAGTPRVDVFAEVDEAAVEVFVRDRGVGFDLAAVPGDRHGVRNSILDRMERHGGTAQVRSEPGGGTEVRLRMPRTEEEA